MNSYLLKRTLTLKQFNPKDLKMIEHDKQLLEDYTQFLLKEGYVDTDVYDEPPTAIDRYLNLK